MKLLDSDKNQLSFKFPEIKNKIEVTKPKKLEVKKPDLNKDKIIETVQMSFPFMKNDNKH
ncbi:MAG: hypothetical protein HRU18_01395 [Pseudoalteromonas sp.]|uniref:hypothetical protein n=1 Tax=Pseudoalteromonas sp. TaxID=53249 RepID=UPI001DA4173A|nr:hypothetical protein [Pseudoalteromonas sp.]NRA76835.1 hypothetical protein [Pseudoalteromonas sp.]